MIEVQLGVEHDETSNGGSCQEGVSGERGDCDRRSSR